MNADTASWPQGPVTVLGAHIPGAARCNATGSDSVLYEERQV